MIPSDRFCEVFRPLSRLCTRVLGPHVTCVEYAITKLLGIGRDVARILRFSSDAPRISDDLLVYRRVTTSTATLTRKQMHLLARVAASATKRHMEYTMIAVAQLSIPPLRGTKYP